MTDLLGDRQRPCDPFALAGFLPYMTRGYVGNELFRNETTRRIEDRSTRLERGRYQEWSPSRLQERDG